MSCLFGDVASPGIGDITLYFLPSLIIFVLIVAISVVTLIVIISLIKKRMNNEVKEKIKKKQSNE